MLAAGRGDGDLRTRRGARDLVERARRSLGGIDLVVHAAAGEFAPRRLEDVDEDDWDAALDVTAKGTLFLGQASALELRASRGVYVVVEDIAAYEPWPAFAAHCAAKAAQSMLTRVLASALAPEVRVCGVAPGAVAVEPAIEARRARETLLGRVGSAGDVADAVAFLAGATFVTGSTLVVDGGTLAQSGAARPP